MSARPTQERLYIIQQMYLQVLGSAHQGELSNLGLDTANRLLEDGAWLPGAGGTFTRPDESVLLKKVTDTMLDLLGEKKISTERVLASLRLDSVNKDSGQQPDTGKPSTTEKDESGPAEESSGEESPNYQDGGGPSLSEVRTESTRDRKTYIQQSIIHSGSAYDNKCSPLTPFVCVVSLERPD